MTDWLPLKDAALARGVCQETIRNAAHDGRVQWRWGRSPTRPKQVRLEVFWPSVSGCQFSRSRGGGGIGTSSGPVTDESWQKFCEVTERLIRQAHERDRA